MLLFGWIVVNFTYFPIDVGTCSNHLYFPTSLFWLVYFGIKCKHCWVGADQRLSISSRLPVQCSYYRENYLHYLFPSWAALLTCIIQLWLLEWLQPAVMMMTAEQRSLPVNNLWMSQAQIVKPMRSGSQRPPLLTLSTFRTAFFMQFFWLLVLSCCPLFFFEFQLLLGDDQYLITVSVLGHQNLRTLHFFCGQERVQSTFIPGSTTDTYWLQLQSSASTEQCSFPILCFKMCWCWA